MTAANLFNDETLGGLLPMSRAPAEHKKSGLGSLGHVLVIVGLHYEPSQGA